MINFIWHMHQPDYRIKNRAFMPWVFLHSIKDYYDMAYLLERTGFKATINLTPVLIEQIESISLENDKFLKTILKDTYTDNERKYLIKILKSLNPNLAVKKAKNYLSQNVFSDEEIKEFGTAFLLSWCGNYLKENSQIVKELLNKRNYSINDLEKLIYELINFTKTILPYYKKLFTQNKISLFTTPYFHPILPLLIDMKEAKKANPFTTLPNNCFSLKEDAKAQIKYAIELFRETFGKNPDGFWPAEGAVSEKAVKLMKLEGIKYIATDEVILYKSGKKNKNAIYEYEGVNIAFRDHFLSDLIGFKYRFLDEYEAAEDFAKRIGDELTSVILDGENAWEYYPKGGYEFLENMYLLLKEKSVFFKDLNADEKLSSLASGSWINGDFNTWVGDAQKNRAWEMLFQTKKDNNGCCEKEFLKAEGSDWFWWYGKGHYTIF